MGFDNESILNIQSLPGEYFCPVCRQLVYPTEAVQTQCTHLYCKPCLTYVLSTTRACTAPMMDIWSRHVPSSSRANEGMRKCLQLIEPIFTSVANVLGRVDNIAKVPKKLKGLEMGQLEIKHRLLQLAESLRFLHYNARLIHRAISPEIVFITSSGAWKLGGFGFAIAIDQVPGDMNVVQAFHYLEYDVEDVVVSLQPSLNYTALEMV